MSEIRIPVKGKAVNAVAVIDTEDVEEFQVSSHRGFDTEPDGQFLKRTPNGENTFTVTFVFKNGKKELWVTMGGEMTWPQYAEVKCRGCGKEYTCTPQDDYFNYKNGPGTGVCFGCMLREAGLDPEKTPVLVLDEHGREVDPRDG